MAAAAFRGKRRSVAQGAEPVDIRLSDRVAASKRPIPLSALGSAPLAARQSMDSATDMHHAESAEKGRRLSLVGSTPDKRQSLFDRSVVIGLRSQAMSSVSSNEFKKKPQRAAKSLIRMGAALEKRKKLGALSSSMDNMETDGIAFCLRYWVAYLRLKAGDLVESAFFNFFIAGMIVTNGVLMGMEIDADSSVTKTGINRDVSYDFMPDGFFDTVEIVFFSIFSVELFIRIFVYGARSFCDFWTYVDTICLLPVVLQFLTGGSGVMSNMLVLRLVRMIKTCRLLRLLRLFRELYLIAAGFVSAMRTLLWISILLGIFLYAGAVFCTVLIGQNENFRSDNELMRGYYDEYGEYYEAERLWGSILRSMVTLLQVFTLDSWTAVVRPVIETHQPWMLIFFVMFIFVTTFGLLNLLIGVLVENTSALQDENESERERILKSKHYQVVSATLYIFQSADEDNSGRVEDFKLLRFMDENDCVSLIEEHCPISTDVCEVAELVDMCKLAVSDDIWSSEQAPNPEEPGLTADEFVGAVLQLHGNLSKKDLMEIVLYCQRSTRRIEKLDSRQSDGFAAMQEQLDALTSHVAHLTNVMITHFGGARGAGGAGHVASDVGSSEKQMTASYGGAAHGASDSESWQQQQQQGVGSATSSAASQLYCAASNVESSLRRLGSASSDAMGNDATVPVSSVDLREANAVLASIARMGSKQGVSQDDNVATDDTLIKEGPKLLTSSLRNTHRQNTGAQNKFLDQKRRGMQSVGGNLIARTQTGGSVYAGDSSGNLVPGVSSVRSDQSKNDFKEADAEAQPLVRLDSAELVPGDPDSDHDGASVGKERSVTISDKIHVKRISVSI